MALHNLLSFWNSVPGDKVFTHPLPLENLKKFLSPEAAILDFGCGYGRSGRELTSAGFHNYIGVDISAGMISRGMSLNPELPLLVFDGLALPFPAACSDACIMMAVLNCIPSSHDQREAVAEIRRVLKPGGIFLLSDYPLQEDRRSQERYRRFAGDYEAFGIFRTGEGGLFRHHRMDWIHDLLSGFEVLGESNREVLTMNGNPAKIFQILARKNQDPPAP